MKGFKIIILSIIFGAIFYYWSQFLNSEETSEEIISQTNQNNVEFENITEKIDVVAHIWTAISVNVWTRHKESMISDIPTLKEVFEIEYIVSNNEIARNQLIRKNMLAINAYKESLKIDIKNELDISTDREKTLNFIISKFEYNYENSKENINTLKLQLSALNRAQQTATETANKTKYELDKEFNMWNSIASLEYMDEYIQARQNEIYANTYRVFINEIIRKYELLNSVNAKLINALNENKEAIIKNTSININASNIQILKDLDLIFEQN